MDKNQEINDKIQKLKRKVLFRSPLILIASLVIPLIPSKMGRIKMTDKIDYPYAVLLMMFIFVSVVIIGYILKIRSIKDCSKYD